MKTKDFYFDLPQELIAQHPLKKRSDSRLLVFQKESLGYEHKLIKNLTDFLQPGDLLVFNDSKVIPARLYGHKESGGRVELLVERLIDERVFLAHIKASKSPKAGQWLYLDQGFKLKVLAKEDDLYRCESERKTEFMLESIGHIPLPPYITRQDESEDKERYQTIYAREKGSVAAPTAGLHFDEALFSQLKAKEIGIAYTTLHVGAGTFRPLRVDSLQEHKMHAEVCKVSEALCARVNQTRAENKRVIAVGTTSLRCLESAADQGRLKPWEGETDIFIYPGYDFQICKGLLTNFHLPESSLLMLVSAFIGHKEAMDLYQEAVFQQYRFFSYGDACLFLV